MSAIKERKYGKVQPVYASQAALEGITCPKLPDRPARVQVNKMPRG